MSNRREAADAPRRSDSRLEGPDVPPAGADRPGAQGPPRPSDGTSASAPSSGGEDQASKPSEEAVSPGPVRQTTLPGPLPHEPAFRHHDAGPQRVPAQDALHTRPRLSQRALRLQALARDVARRLRRSWLVAKQGVEHRARLGRTKWQRWRARRGRGDDGTVGMAAPGHASGGRSVQREGAWPVERAVLTGGIVLATLLAIEVAILYFSAPHLGKAVAAAVGAGLVLGREAGIPLGLTLGVDPWLMFQLSFTQDLAAGAIGYGGLMVLVQGPGRAGNWMRRLMHHAEQDARESGGLVRRWGRFGLFIFMLVPFLVNGPLVGGTAGRLGGIRTRELILPVVAANIAAAATWVLFSRALLSLAAGMEPGLQVALTAMFLGGMLAFAIYRLVRAQLRMRAEARRRPWSAMARTDDRRAD